MTNQQKYMLEKLTTQSKCEDCNLFWSEYLHDTSENCEDKQQQKQSFCRNPIHLTLSKCWITFLEANKDMTVCGLCRSLSVTREEWNYEQPIINPDERAIRATAGEDCKKCGGICYPCSENKHCSTCGKILCYVKEARGLKNISNKIKWHDTHRTLKKKFHTKNAGDNINDTLKQSAPTTIMTIYRL